MTTSVVLQSSDMGYKVYERPGYRTVVEYMGYVDPASLPPVEALPQMPEVQWTGCATADSELHWKGRGSRLVEGTTIENPVTNSPFVPRQHDRALRASTIHLRLPWAPRRP